MARPADPHAREALIVAARAEFARCGLRGARIEDVTAACDLSKGAFYLHFPSKESLFGELVAAFNKEMEGCNRRRVRMMQEFRTRHGPVDRRDVETRSERYLRLLELEAEEDLRALESMWTFRDVLSVLLTGAQGTQFEGAIWKILERETARVAADLDELRCHGAIRADIPKDIFASLVIGTWFLIGQRMIRMTEKPDLRSWAVWLQTLIREGSAPGHEAAPAVQKKVVVRTRPSRLAAARKGSKILQGSKKRRITP